MHTRPSPCKAQPRKLVGATWRGDSIPSTLQPPEAASRIHMWLFTVSGTGGRRAEEQSCPAV